MQIHISHKNISIFANNYLKINNYSIPGMFNEKLEFSRASTIFKILNLLIKGYDNFSFL